MVFRSLRNILSIRVLIYFRASICAQYRQVCPHKPKSRCDVITNCVFRIIIMDSTDALDYFNTM